MLDDHGMEGTFFIIPGRVDRPSSPYMTWTQVQTIYDHGNEIGGHTQNHLHLPTLPESQQRSEICDGRQALLNRGYPQVSFAYPFGDHDATSERLVQECGYLSGRGVSGLGGTGEPKAETVPPREQVGDPDPRERRRQRPPGRGRGLDHGRGSRQQEHRCPDLDEPRLPSPLRPGRDELRRSQWGRRPIHDALRFRRAPRLAAGSRVNGHRGEDDRRDDGGAAAAARTRPRPSRRSRATAPPARAASTTTPSQRRFSATDTGGSGLKEIRYTTNGTDPTTSSPLYSGPITVNSTTTIKFRAWDNAGNAEAVKSQTISVDAAKPISAIQCNGTSCASGFYNSTVSATLTGSDTGGAGLKNIRYTTNGTDPTGSSTVYSGAIPVSSTTTIKWRAEDNAGNIESPIHSQTISVDTAKPTSAIKCDGAACSSVFYNHNVSATLSGSDTGGSGLKNIRYTTNGSTPTSSSPVYTGPISVSSTTTIKWRAEDNVGNLEAIRSQTISIDKVKPTSTIRCNGATCKSSIYNGSVSATLSGTDTGGSGVKNIRYTTNGSTPTGSSPIYTGPISVTSTKTINWRAEDNAGNVESIHSQQIRVR